jgi:hypothetical protein
MAPHIEVPIRVILALFSFLSRNIFLFETALFAFKKPQMKKHF